MGKKVFQKSGKFQLALPFHFPKVCQHFFHPTSGSSDQTNFHLCWDTSIKPGTYGNTSTDCSIGTWKYRICSNNRLRRIVGSCLEEEWLVYFWYWLWNMLIHSPRTLKYYFCYLGGIMICFVCIGKCGWPDTCRPSQPIYWCGF